MLRNAKAWRSRRERWAYTEVSDSRRVRAEKGKCHPEAMPSMPRIWVLLDPSAPPAGGPGSSLKCLGARRDLLLMLPQPELEPVPAAGQLLLI